MEKVRQHRVAVDNLDVVLSLVYFIHDDSFHHHFGKQTYEPYAEMIDVRWNYTAYHNKENAKINNYVEGHWNELEKIIGDINEPPEDWSEARKKHI